MQVNGIEKRAIEVSEADIAKLFLKNLCSKINFKLKYYIRDNNIYYSEEVYTSHSFDREIFVREATEDDIKNYKLLQDLLTILRDKKDSND